MVAAQQNAKSKQRNVEEIIKRSSYWWFFIFKVQVSANPIVKNKINIIRQPSVDLTEPNLLVNSFKSKAGEALLDLFWDYTPFKK